MCQRLDVGVVDRINLSLLSLRQLPALVGPLAAARRAEACWPALRFNIDATIAPFTARRFRHGTHDETTVTHNGPGRNSSSDILVNNAGAAAMARIIPPA
jgi:hypothetical protein